MIQKMDVYESDSDTCIREGAIAVMWGMDKMSSLSALVPLKGTLMHKHNIYKYRLQVFCKSVPELLLYEE